MRNDGGLWIADCGFVWLAFRTEGTPRHADSYHRIRNRQSAIRNWVGGGRG